MNVKTEYAVASLTIAVILASSVLLIVNVYGLAVVSGNETSPTYTVEKHWDAGEDPAPPLPEDTGGVTSPDGTKKTWGHPPEDAYTEDI